MCTNKGEMGIEGVQVEKGIPRKSNQKQTLEKKMEKKVW